MNIKSSAVLKQAEVGVPIAELIRKAGIRSRHTTGGRRSMRVWRWIRYVRSSSFEMRTRG